MANHFERREEAAIIEDLRQPLDVSRVKTHPHGGYSYLGGHDVIEHLNRIFGYTGWNDSIESIDEVSMAGEKRMFRARVTLSVSIGRDMVRHSDVGVGTALKGGDREVDKAIKEAVTDALKRAARKFGDQFGNCLYDKEAPEHSGQQRPTLATREDLELYEVWRQAAIGLGFKTPSGNDPKALDGNVTQAECWKRTVALQDWYEAESAKHPLPDSLPAKTEQGAEAA